MPLIEVTLPKGLLAAKERAALADELAGAVLKAEGAPDTPKSRSLTWVFVHEAPEGAWVVKGAGPEGPRVLVRITVPDWSLSPARRRRVGRDVHRALSARFGRPLGVEEAWILIHEVPPGDWNAGGSDLTGQNRGAYMGLRLPRKKT
jgi:phenylpyruvate tautomerase PptA (4-oxalocrotonate tautomerase family)